MNEDTARQLGQWMRYYLLTREGQHELVQWMPYVLGAAVGFVVLMLIVSWVVRGGHSLRKGKYVRGTRLIIARGAWLKRALRWSSTVVIAGVRWPRKLHPLHLLVSGAPGTGKSQTLNGALEAIRERGERAIIADLGGEAMGSLAAQGDFVLNPFAKYAVRWSPFAEMESAADADRLAKSMIPDREGTEREWFAYAQALVSAVLRRLWENGNATNESLLHALTQASPAELKELVTGLPAQALFHEGAERMLGSVRGIVGSYLAPYAYLPKEAGAKSWSIRRHVREGKTWLWLPYREDQVAALRPLLAAWLGEAVSAMLSMHQDLKRRHWLALDEVASLGRVQGLSDALTKGRKYGLCAILGLQSVAQLRAVYGSDGAQTLLSCLSSQLILRANDPETAEYASRHLGECEVERESVTRGREGATRTKSYHVERVALPSEIQSLGNRRGYLRFAEDDRVRRVKVPLVKRKAYLEVFEPHAAAPAPAPSVVVPSRPPLDADAILNSR